MVRTWTRLSVKHLPSLLTTRSRFCLKGDFLFEMAGQSCLKAGSIFERARGFKPRRNCHKIDRGFSR
jgi:hypothetical protein